MRTVCRHAGALEPGGVVVFTLKTPGTESFAEIQVLAGDVLEIARNQGMEIVSLTHLEYNRHEFTLIARRSKQRESL